MTSLKKYLSFAVLTLLFFSMQFCKKQTESYPGPLYQDYYPLEVGKYIIYRLDSTVFVNFDTEKEVHSYQAKDIVDAEITDATGRPSYRIRRMIRDIDGTGEWKDNATFMATPLQRSLEYVENNLRFIKLTNPLQEGYYWEGNSYINSTGDFTYLQNWEYNYRDIGLSYTVNDNIFENTITVPHIDETVGDPELFPDNYASRDYSMEVYAKNTGLVYKDFIHWVYQRIVTESNCRVILPNPNDPPVPCPSNLDCDSLALTMNGYKKCDTIRNPFSYIGYGIRLSAIEYN